MVETTFRWVTTSPNPRHPGTGYDAGQKGWRLHVVPMKEGETYAEYKRRPALCGTSPRHGWGLDLFIEDECSRCQSAMKKREAATEVFVELAEVARAKRESEMREVAKRKQLETASRIDDDDEY